MRCAARCDARDRTKGKGVTVIQRRGRSGGDEISDENMTHSPHLSPSLATERPEDVRKKEEKKDKILLYCRLALAGATGACASHELLYKS